LLFLAAGSVIIGMHHEQDMRKMGGLRKYMPITYWTALIGSLALIAFPGTSGFFSKDAIIEAVGASHIPGATYAYWCVLLGVFVTALYSFRLIFMTFHGPERFATAAHHGADESTHVQTDADAGHEPDVSVHDSHGHEDHHGAPHESPWVVTLPLILLAIPSLLIGWFTVQPVLFGDYFGGAIFVDQVRNTLEHVAEEFHGSAAFTLHALQTGPFWLMVLGVATAWFLYIKRPDLPAKIASMFAPIYKLFANKYYFDELYQAVFARGSRRLGSVLWRAGDVALIDGALVNGSAQVVGWFSGVLRRVQTGYLYHYAFAMIIGLSAMLAWYVLR
jgi:NADH-quinone oxidoreductase subunit L